MTLHTIHHPRVGAVLSDPDCPRCQQRRLGELDNAHLAALGLSELPHILETDFPQLYGGVMALRALDVQAECMERRRGAYAPPESPVDIRRATEAIAVLEEIDGWEQDDNLRDAIDNLDAFVAGEE